MTEVKAEKAEKEDVQLRCSYILVKKNRRCRMLVKKGKDYCGEHAIFENGNTERIICPNDGKHTILLSDLDNHLKKCNSRLGDEEYIRPDANSIISETKYDQKIDRRPTTDEIVDVIHKICNYFDEGANQQIIVDYKEHELVEKYLKENENLGATKKKHLAQISSIMKHIDDCGCLPNQSTSCMFELGAGKGQLAYWISKLAPNANYVLMDRSGCRNKWDNKALRENSALSMRRYRCSIEHMDLAKIEVLSNSTHILAVCKHFCGSATDAGIRSLLNSGLAFDAALLIPCCHHKSRFVEYGGRETLAKYGMDTEEAFSALRYIASFATNGANEEEEYESMSWKSIYPPLELGRRAKAILEIGRAEWLNRVGFETRVVEYVPSSVSPENLLILAIRK